MEDIHKKIEAVLFTTGRFLTQEEIAQLSGIPSQDAVKGVIKELMDAYALRDSALEIIQQGEAFKLNLRKEYLYVTTKLLSDAELDKPTQETLALIAYKNPALQAEIVHMRGSTAYDHIKKLKELEFVASEKSGRTFLLKTTPKFYEYFDIIDAQLKQKFEQASQSPAPSPASEEQQTFSLLPQPEHEN